MCPLLRPSFLFTSLQKHVLLTSVFYIDLDSAGLNCVFFLRSDMLLLPSFAATLLLLASFGWEQPLFTFYFPSSMHDGCFAFTILDLNNFLWLSRHPTIVASCILLSTISEQNYRETIFSLVLFFLFHCFRHGFAESTFIVFRRLFLYLQRLARGSRLSRRRSQTDARPSQLLQEACNVVWPWARELLQFRPNLRRHASPPPTACRDWFRQGVPLNL